MTVLDASAVLALLHDEPGADFVAAELGGAVMSAVNLAEVVGKLLNAEVDSSRVRSLLEDAGVRMVAFDAQETDFAGALRAIDEGKSLSLGYRCCLALATRFDPPTVLAADRLWADLDLSIEVRFMIR